MLNRSDGSTCNFLVLPSRYEHVRRSAAGSLCRVVRHKSDSSGSMSPEHVSNLESPARPKKRKLRFPRTSNACNFCRRSVYLPTPLLKRDNLVQMQTMLSIFTYATGSYLDTCESSLRQQSYLCSITCGLCA